MDLMIQEHILLIWISLKENIRNRRKDYRNKTDKNGRKIFENNYCLLTKPCVMAWGVIKYKNACYWFIESKTQADGTNNMIRLCDLESNGYEIQVKGNIRDNPELLEVSE
ncbi:hypothetical protein FMM68_03890 [Lachnospiraceae bacterium MD329]|nr:hypothetical protein [Lachnospiraceae bacterium MD329]